MQLHWPEEALYKGVPDSGAPFLHPLLPQFSPDTLPEPGCTGEMCIRDRGSWGANLLPTTVKIKNIKRMLNIMSAFFFFMLPSPVRPGLSDQSIHKTNLSGN